MLIRATFSGSRFIIGVRTECYPGLPKYYIMHRIFSLRHEISFIAACLRLISRLSYGLVKATAQTFRSEEI